MTCFLFWVSNNILVTLVLTNRCRTCVPRWLRAVWDWWRASENNNLSSPSESLSLLLCLSFSFNYEMIDVFIVDNVKDSKVGRFGWLILAKDDLDFKPGPARICKSRRWKWALKPRPMAPSGSGVEREGSRWADVIKAGGKEAEKVWNHSQTTCTSDGLSVWTVRHKEKMFTVTHVQSVHAAFCLQQCKHTLLWNTASVKQGHFPLAGRDGSSQIIHVNRFIWTNVDSCLR